MKNYVHILSHNSCEDQFTFYIRYINNHQFDITILRTDSNSPWGHPIKLCVYDCDFDKYEILDVTKPTSNPMLYTLHTTQILLQDGIPQTKNVEEQDCLWVNSRGILKSCDIHSKTPISGIHTLINYTNYQPNQPTEKTTNTKLFHICGSSLHNFYAKILPTLTSPIILICNDCDDTIPHNQLNDSDFLKLIQHPNIVHFFSQNLEIKKWSGFKDKISIIPIGLDYHTLFYDDNSSWGPRALPFEQEKTLTQIINNAKPLTERISHKIYINFGKNYPSWYKGGNDRKRVFEQIDASLLHIEKSGLIRTQTWQNQTDFAFILSPPGNGMDCHRHYESILLGNIVIMKRTEIDELFADFPVIFVDHWSEINSDFLQYHYNIFKNKESIVNYDKLKLSYWKNFFLKSSQKKQ